jgi:hypothetical protein
MLKNFINHITTLLLAILTLTSCHDKNDEPTPIVGRSVLVYMVADNSLGSSGYDQLDFDEMLTAAHNGDFGNNRLIIYHDGISGTPTLYEITPEGQTTLLEYSLDDASVSSTRMAQVISDFKRLAPADNYGLILWSHASGWLQNGMESPEEAVTQSFGQQRGRYMNVTTLADVLQGQGFDYVYFDCCYMASVEVAYELRHVAHYMVGSATELPATGMPYDQTLRYLMADQADLQAACQATFDSYNNLSGRNRTCTISLIDLNAIGDLANATKEIFASRPTLPEAFTPQKYMIGTCYLYDLGQYVTALTSDAEALSRWDAALQSAVVYSAATPSIWNSLRITNYSGLSTAILESEADAHSSNNYYQLQWWSDVVAHLFQ